MYGKPNNNKAQSYKRCVLPAWHRVSAGNMIFKKIYFSNQSLLFLFYCVRISLDDIQVCAAKRHLTKSPYNTNKCKNMAISKRQESDRMGESTKYFVVKQKAVPEVLLKVVEAKRLLESEKVMTIQEAVDAVGISRSSFYKYKDDIFRFHDNSQGTTITLTFQMDDEPGILSDVLKIIAEYQANILTIHQSIPISGIASLSLSVQVLQTTGDISRMIEKMEEQKGVHHVKILAKE